MKLLMVYTKGQKIPNPLLLACMKPIFKKNPDTI
jgi:hypothetical protein